MTDEISPQGTESDTAPLSLSDAANAYAGTMTTEEPDEGQPEDDIAPEGDLAEDDAELAEEDEAGEDDEEGDPEDEGQAEDEDGEPESDQGRYVAANGKVRLPDGSTATVADLIQGNLRDRDYRQKTMAHAEVVKAFESQSQAVKQRETQVNERADYMVNLLNAIVPPAPDPAIADPRSPNYDPAGYISQKAQHEQWMQHLQYLDQQKQLSTQQSQAEAETRQKEKLQKEWASALEKLPELKDQKRLERFGQDVNKFGIEHGYSEQEMAVVHHDHRNLVILKKAMAWDKLQANKSKVAAKVEGRPPVQKGGSRLDPTRAKARDGRVAMDRLQSSGKLADGVAALLALEGKG